MLIDVRSPAEVAMTGKLLPDAITVPLPEIFAEALDMNEDDFEERYNLSLHATLTIHTVPAPIAILTTLVQNTIF